MEANYGLIISMIGFFGMFFSFIEKSTSLGGKIPLVLFFLVVMCIGIVILMIPKNQIEDIYGELPSKNNFR